MSMFKYINPNKEVGFEPSKLIKIMKTQGIVSELDIKPVIIKPWRVRNTIRKAGYDWVNPFIRDAKTKNMVRNPGIRNMGLWHPNRRIFSEDANLFMRSMTVTIDRVTLKGRPSTIEEIASYEAVFHEELGEIGVAALGEKILDDTGEYFAYRYLDGSRCNLDILGTSDIELLRGWPPSYRFLVVFE